MPGNAIIGALRAVLGLDTAQFNDGLKKAQAGLSGFGDAAKVAFGLVAAAAAASTVALGAAVRASVDHADALSKSAQRAGVTVEALSRLEYAAKLSDVSLESLTGGLQKLSKAMADATITKTSTAAIAFKALGINITDASGKLRSSSAVLGEIADRFARLEDGSTKTALAMQIFGKSGAELIPLLNGGAKGLADMAAEADRLGLTISGSTARAAEKFNDTLTKIAAIMDGVVNKIMEAALPSMQALADTLADPIFEQAAQTIGVGLVDAVNLVANSFENAFRWARDFAGMLKNIPVVGLNAGFKIGGVQIGAGETPRNSSGSPDDRGSAPLAITVHGGSTSNTPLNLPSFGSLAKTNNAIKDGLKATGSALDEVQKKAQSFADTAAAAFSNFADAVLSGTSPLQAVSSLLADIGKQFLNVGIQALFRSLFAGVGGGSLFSIPGFAAGTASAPAGLAWVGENGPELVNFRGGESVMSAAQSAGMGGPNISISISGSRQDAAEIARQVGKTLPDAIAAYNRNPRRRN